MITQLESQERIEKMRARLGEMIELGRMRSDFVLRHFVVGQHDTPGAQRAQALNELQTLFFALADVQDDIEIAQIDLEEITGDNRRSQVERRRLVRKIENMRIYLHQRMKEVDYLLELLDVLPPYKAESLEAEEPIRWAARLSRQAFMAQRDPGGNLNAMMEYITTPGMMKPLTPISMEGWLKSLGLPVGQIAAGLHAAQLITAEQASEMVRIDQQQQQKQITPPPAPSSHHRKRR